MLASLAMAATFGAAAASTAAPTEDDYARLNDALVESVVLPVYREHARATAGLREAVDALCARGGDAALEAARGAFRSAMEAWQHAQPIAFGPITYEHGPARVEHWPDPQGTGARQLRNALAARALGLLEPGGLADQSVAIADLQALEDLLFGDPPRMTADDPYPCALAAAIARHQAALAQDVLERWSGEDGFAQAVRGAHLGNEAYHDAKEATQDFLRSIAQSLDLVAQKLGRPLGETLEQAKPKRAESWRSDRSLANIAANLETLAALFGSEAGFSDLLTLAGAGPLADGIERILGELAATARAIPLPLDAAVADPIERVCIETLAQRVAGLRLLIQGSVADTLALALGFNALDGD